MSLDHADLIGQRLPRLAQELERIANSPRVPPRARELAREHLTAVTQQMVEHDVLQESQEPRRFMRYLEDSHPGEGRATAESLLAWCEHWQRWCSSLSRFV
jgi:hypothetical protein